MLSLWGLSLPDPRYFINHSPNCKAEPVTTQASSGHNPGLFRVRDDWSGRRRV